MIKRIWFLRSVSIIAVIVDSLVRQDAVLSYTI